MELCPDASSPMAQMYLAPDPKKLSRDSDAVSKFISGYCKFCFIAMDAAKVAIMAALIKKDIKSEKALSIWL